ADIPRIQHFSTTSAVGHAGAARLWRMYRDANETVTVQYVAFDPNEMIPAAQVTITDAAIREYYNAHRDEFVRPAQVEVRYVTLNAAPPPEDTVAARQRAEELRAAAASGESDRKSVV